ncbi:MAG: hypothetical protein OXC80_00420, partial [Gammaproteobacteria bacterium]|nr:hypothetical protein [Gammaproteobacteria bacterium]
ELSKNIRDQMLNKGEDPDAVPEREIYYLIFGINKRARPAPLYKICLVHGAFFETISTESAIKQAFQEMLEECGITVDQFIWEEATINQNTINRSRHPTDSSFRIRFRMMAEAHKNANLLNSNLYPAITDNSLSLVLPFENEKSEFPKDSQSSLEYVKLWDVADSIRSNKRFKSIQIAFNEQDTEIMDSTSIGVLRSQISGYFLHVRVDSPTTKSI